MSSQPSLTGFSFSSILPLLPSLFLLLLSGDSYWLPVLSWASMFKIVFLNKSLRVIWGASIVVCEGKRKGRNKNVHDESVWVLGGLRAQGRNRHLNCSLIWHRAPNNLPYSSSSLPCRKEKTILPQKKNVFVQPLQITKKLETKQSTSWNHTNLAVTSHPRTSTTFLPIIWSTSTIHPFLHNCPAQRQLMCSPGPTPNIQ